MSIDTIDDLHAAEDRIAELYDALRSLVRVDDWRRSGINAAAASSYAVQAGRAWRQARKVVDADDGTPIAWCRPSCGWASDGECADGEDECGCLCGHGD